MFDEHITPAFALVLQAYGHEVMSRFPMMGLSDDELLAATKREGCDFLVSLDNNRQREVWSRLYLKLAEGDGRLLRIKLRGTELPSIPNLTRVWASGYPNFEPYLTDKRKVLIQVGLSLHNNSTAKRGFETYTRQQVAALVQQEMSLHSGRLQRQGSPRAKGNQGKFRR